MQTTGMKCLSCICACVLVSINLLVILFAVLCLAVGIVLAFGTNWITQNETISDALNKLSEVMKDVNILELIGNLRSITGSVGAAFIVIGVVLIVIACLGCFGSCCKNKTCLITYAAVVGVIFTGQLTVVIIWYSDSNVLKSAAKDAMERSVQNYQGLRSTNVESLLQNLVQIFAGCCGVNGGSDFNSVNWDRQFSIQQPGGRNFSFNLTYPVTCCEFDLVTIQPRYLYCPYNNTLYSNHAKGCYNEVFTFVEKYFLNTFFAGLVGVLVWQFLMVAGALLICYAESDNSTKRNRISPGDYK